MKIGLIRHFKVNCKPKIFMSSKDFEDWAVLYDDADVIQNEVNLSNIQWNKCYSSDLSRALKTADAIFTGKTIKTPKLREVPLSPIFKTNVKLPYLLWCICGRAAWLFTHKSQVENKKQTENRINKFLDSIEENEDINILVVTHGFFMHQFQKELTKRGYKGGQIKSIKNGILYIFENKNRVL